MRQKVALSVAGSDPSGGAGLQADLKTFHTHGVYGCAVPTLLTVQNTRAVSRVELIAADMVSDQLRAVLADLPVAAAKTGALGSAATIEVVAAAMRESDTPVIIDPVRLATHGAVLLADDARRALIDHLLPRAALCTPNLAEASWLSGRGVENEEDARDAARAIADLGARAVLVKGGHLDGAPVDTLYLDGRFERLTVARIESPHTHGLGCALSAAITAHLAKGIPLLQACALAQAWVARAIASAPGLGGGRGPIDHLAPPSTPQNSCKV